MLKIRVAREQQRRSLIIDLTIVTSLTYSTNIRIYANSVIVKVLLDFFILA